MPRCLEGMRMVLASTLCQTGAVSQTLKSRQEDMVACWEDTLKANGNILAKPARVKWQSAGTN